MLNYVLSSSLRFKIKEVEGCFLEGFVSKCVRESESSFIPNLIFFFHCVLKFHPHPPPPFLQPPPPKTGKENYVNHPCQFLLFGGVLGIFLLQLPLMTWFFFIKHGQQRQKWLRLIKIKSQKGWERELFLEAHQNTMYAWIHAHIQCLEAHVLTTFLQHLSFPDMYFMWIC